jgi:acetyl-CoA synthetase/medium-chain acyl-CoA synthetase
MGHRITGELWLDLKPSDVHWCITDTGWAKAAWSCLFGPWQMGACVFATDSRGKFDSAAALRTLAQYPITTCARRRPLCERSCVKIYQGIDFHNFAIV